jgi:hypothetical protein
MLTEMAHSQCLQTRTGADADFIIANLTFISERESLASSAEATRRPTVHTGRTHTHAQVGGTRETVLMHLGDWETPHAPYDFLEPRVHSAGTQALCCPRKGIW